MKMNVKPTEVVRMKAEKLTIRWKERPSDVTVKTIKWTVK